MWSTFRGITFYILHAIQQFLSNVDGTKNEACSVWDDEYSVVYVFDAYVVIVYAIVASFSSLCRTDVSASVSLQV